MGGDYNEKDALYESLFQAHSDRTFGVLTTESKDFHELITKTLALKYQEAKDNEDKVKESFYKSIDSCKSCLDGFLYQCVKLANHNEGLKQKIPERDTTDTMACFSSIEACTDFESLLYQARATLDRLTFFLSKQIYHNETDKFNKLEKVLKNFTKKDPRAVNTIRLIKSCIKNFQGLLIDDYKGRTSLRSLLAHSKSHEELVNGSFTIHRSQDAVLIFDQEIHKYPMVISAHILNKYIPFLVLNILAIYLEIGELEEEKFIPSWKPLPIDASSFIIDEKDPNAVKFSVTTSSLIGVTFNTYSYHKDIISKAYTVK